MTDLTRVAQAPTGARGDPEPEAKAWAEALLEVEHKRDRYKDISAADAMTLGELKAKLDALKETPRLPSASSRC